MRCRTLRICWFLYFLLPAAVLGSSRSFVNWETPHVHPLELTPDRARLLAVNTPDNRLEVFDVTGDRPRWIGSVPVGLDPVSVRARTNREAWVVNHISDSVSVVDIERLHVTATLRTDNEPADVVFAGSPVRAFVSCAQPATLLVVDPEFPNAEIREAGVEDSDEGPVTWRVRLVGQEPRALAVSADGRTVFVAMFESGNGTTLLSGGGATPRPFPPNAVDDRASPYFDPVEAYVLGVNPPNPPPNWVQGFRPPLRPGVPPPIRVGLIVQRNEFGNWLDDNGRDWFDLVSGAAADRSGRSIGWDLLDHDVAVVRADSLETSYVGGLMNLCMALAVQPRVNRVTVVGTDATNEVRFEPVLQGRFLRVNLASFQPSRPGVAPTVRDLNPHLIYGDEIPLQRIPPAQRRLSIGDPRAIVWDAMGARGYVAGMGSDNVIVLNADGLRESSPLSVGEGPTGLALDEVRQRLYVLNKFESSLTVVDTSQFRELLPRIRLFDPTPRAIRVGRTHLYNSHENSGLGHISCASCHVDGRTDRLAWDLGDPSGAMQSFEGNCDARLNIFCGGWHPMKGPMTTQTLQDIIGREPHHWRGDRRGLEQFAGAFEGLMGADEPLSREEMREFEDFLATIHFPPNPFRHLDNALSEQVPLAGHYSVGRFEPEGGLAAGEPLPDGNAVHGLHLFNGKLDEGGVTCVRCHTLPTGLGPDGVFTQGQFVALPPGPDGERHHAIGTMDGLTNASMKTPQLRNMYKKTGLDFTQMQNTAGFGFLHDGSIDSLARFITRFVDVRSDQDVADLVAFMLSFSGGGLPEGDPGDSLRLPGTHGQDSHAAVGRQVTVASPVQRTSADALLIDEMVRLAGNGRVGLVARSLDRGIPRGYVYIGLGIFQSDRAGEQIHLDQLLAGAAPLNETTFTVVPAGTEARIGVDRDEDGYLDRDELDFCGDPADAGRFPVSCPLHGDLAAPRCLINLLDVLYVLDAYGDADPCGNFPGADLIPCDSPCTLVEVSDVLSILSAFRGLFDCAHACPRSPF
jgi:YVTN family beta-propeller protein